MTKTTRLGAWILGIGLSFAGTVPPPAAAQSAKPVVPICGNSVVEGGEQCDDGGLCRGTKTTCKSSSDCGPGVACAPVAGDGCDASCAKEYQLSVVQPQATATVMQEQPKYELYQAPRQETAMVIKDEPKYEMVKPQYTLIEQQPVTTSRTTKEPQLEARTEAAATATVYQEPKLEVKTEASATATVYQEPQYEAKKEASATATVYQQPTLEAKREDTAIVSTYQQPQYEAKKTDTAINTTRVGCGNGIMEAGEGCDDGNLVNGDGCTSGCLAELAATAKTEYQAEYQPMQAQPKYEAKTEYQIGYKPNEIYVVARCGDGKINTDSERCDDGNTADGDGCNAYCQIEMKAVTGEPAQVEETKPEGSRTGTVHNIDEPETKPCADFDASKDYDGEPCTKESCDLATGKFSRALVGECVGSEPGCDVLTCKYMVPECKVSGPSSASTGDAVTFTVTDAAGLPFSAFHCTEAPAAPAGTAEAAIAVSQKDYTKDVYTNEATAQVAMTPKQYDSEAQVMMAPEGYSKDAYVEAERSTAYRTKQDMVFLAQSETMPAATAVYGTRQSMNYNLATANRVQTYGDETVVVTRTLSIEDPNTLKQGTYDAVADGDKVISCTVTGRGGTSAPCETTVRVSQCEFSCGQPNGDSSGARSTSVGLDADCKLVQQPAASACSVSIDGGANAPIAAGGLVKVPTDASGVHTFEAVCHAETSKAYCKDSIEVRPVCEAVGVTINGEEGLTAREGDTVSVAVSAKGAKQCAVMVNGSIAAPNADGTVTFKAAGAGGIAIDAVCTGGTDLKGDSLVAACPGAKIAVAAPSCGNGTLEAGESCDDGNDDTSDDCVNCQAAACGDGFPHAGAEECDYGAKNDDLGACTKSCKQPVCGDGLLQKSLGEQCDDANTASDDGCSSACGVEACGDGITQAGESCDAAQTYEGKECLPDCSAFVSKTPVVSTPPPADTAPPAAKVVEAAPPPPPPPPPVITDIPWVKPAEEAPAITVMEPKKGDYLAEPPKAVGGIREPIDLPPIVYEPPATQPAEDACLKLYPNKESPEYQCCEAYGGYERSALEAPKGDAKKLALEGERTSTRLAETKGGAFECCVKGIVKPHADGKLTPEEDQACNCHYEPELAFCMPCLGPQQADDLQACAAGLSPAPITITKDPATGKVIIESGKMKASTDLCACPSPQTTSSSFACDDKEDLRLHFAGPAGFSCLYPEQVEHLKKDGSKVKVTEDPLGYRLLFPTTASACAELGGETQPYEPETRRAIAVEELAPAVRTKVGVEDIVAVEKAFLATEVAQAAPEAAENVAENVGDSEAKSAMALAEKGVTRDRILEAAPLPAAEIDTDVRKRELSPLEPKGGGRVLCSVLRPACVCEGPDEPETLPETPPVTTVPAAEPTLKIAVCRWNDDHAVMLDTGEEVAIKECPALPIKAFTSAESYSLYQVVSRYYGKPTDSHLAEVRSAILAELNNTKGGDPIITTSSMALPAPEDGADLTALDLASVRDQFAVKKTVEMREDGTLKIKDAKALSALTSSAALTAGPEIVSAARLFKNASTAEAASGNVLVVGSDAAQATGGLGGCSLIVRGR